MNLERKKEYIKDLKAQEKKAEGRVILENIEEIVDPIIGLELWEFEVLSGENDEISEEAYCADFEISMSFQGKEMRIYIKDGKLCVYTD